MSSTPKRTKLRAAPTAQPNQAPTQSARKRGGPKVGSGEAKIVQVRADRGTPRIRYEIPTVAKHLARVIVMRGMDYEGALRYLLGDRAQEVNISKIAENLEHDQQVQKFIQEELTVHGLDDASKESYLHELWDWFRHGSENKAMKAAGILGRGFVAERVETTKPEDLPIPGLGPSVRRMLGEKDAVTNDATIPVKKTDTNSEDGSVRLATNPKLAPN